MGPATDQTIVFGTLALALVLFAAGPWRYDLVALIALLIVVLTGVVDAGDAFAGFGHPAVVTVAAVLIISRGLQNVGIVDLVARWLERVGDRPLAQVTALTGLVAACSAFMNNVGALALLIPVAMQTARRSKASPAIFLMPLAFGSLLGGMTTLIGTPPNIIIAAYRAEVGGEPFRMFDFSYAGVGIAVAGVAFVSLAGWRLIPERKGQVSSEELFHVADYLTEVRIPEHSPMVGKPLLSLEHVDEVEVTVVRLVRNDRPVLVPSSFEVVRPGDVLLVEADSDDLERFLKLTATELAASRELESQDDAPGAPRPDELGLVEAVVVPGSFLDGRTAGSLYLRRWYGVNLLAVARQGARLRDRLSRIRLQAGDVILLQGASDSLAENLQSLGCLPLAPRELRFGSTGSVTRAVLVFATGLVLAAMGLLPVQVALAAAALVMVLGRMLTPREAYESVNWPVIVLLGAMMPVGGALESSGGAERIAHMLLRLDGYLPPSLMVAGALVTTMFLSDVINNAAAAILMAPIALGVAAGMGVSPDPFLMGVAIGASCAFLTPIGHQSNTLVMGPGGYRFSDYWRMGLPLEGVIVLVAVPLLLWFWPLTEATG